VVVVAALQWGLTPWALHIGNRWTLLGEWTGLGAVQAGNGGRYELWVDVQGGGLAAQTRGGRLACSQHGCDTLRGQAQLCTRDGHRYTFAVSGRVLGFWTTSTDGAGTNLDLTGGRPQRLPSGWVVAWHGHWAGELLALSNPDNSFTEVFTPAGAIRSTTSTADAGTAGTTLQYGTLEAFDQACTALRTGH
jgi:hypothetical protein